MIDQQSSDLVYPLERPPDKRLALKAYVMGVSLEGETTAFPLDLFADTPLVEDTVGGEPLVFLASDDASLVQLFSRRTDDDRTLHMRQTVAETFEDRETGSTWTNSGACVAGEFEGRQLEAIPHYNKIFWCVWADFFPDTKVYSLPAAGQDGSTGAEAASNPSSISERTA